MKFLYFLKYVITYFRWKRCIKNPYEVRKRADCFYCTWTVFNHKLYLMTLCKHHEESEWWRYSAGFDDIKEVIIQKRV